MDEFCLDDYCNSDRKFKGWMREVDRVIANALSATEGIVFDIPVRGWRHAYYSCGEKPWEAVESLIGDPEGDGFEDEAWQTFRPYRPNIRGRSF